MKNETSGKQSKIEFYESLAKEIKNNLSGRKRPLIIEFTGLPKAGKTTVVNSLSLFLRRNGIQTYVVTERASICPIKDKHSPEFNIWTACMTLSNLLNYKQSNNYSVIIVDRGIYDALIWMDLWLKRGKIKKDELESIKKFFLLERWSKHVDLIIFMYTSIEKAIEREFKVLLTSKPGSIMNKKFLEEFLDVSKKVIDTFENKFNQIIKIDTTNTTTLDGVERVVSKALESLKKLSDEELIVFSKDVFQERLDFQGLETNRNKFKILERILKSKSIILRRSEAESNRSYIQPVVIAFLTYRKKISIFTKYEKDKHKRLHNKKMIWLGGHLQKVDADNLSEITLQQSATNCLVREIQEELQLSLEYKPVFVGLVYDKTHSKSLQHLGIVFSIEIKEEKIFNSINNKKINELSGQGIGIEFVPLEPKYFKENIDSLEPWSVDILSKIYGINTKRSSSQMVLF